MFSLIATQYCIIQVSPMFVSNPQKFIFIFVPTPFIPCELSLLESVTRQAKRTYHFSRTSTWAENNKLVVIPLFSKLATSS